MSKYDYQKIASEYDDMVKQYNWHAPELIYDHLSEFVRKGTKILDIGVGTGISSERFYENQVELYGLDNSSDLIEVCKSKNVFK
jgi:ubiquinone/menaquinone biosynthesis C-methylase UbiE